jgi:hypothetical protein
LADGLGRFVFDLADVQPFAEEEEEEEAGRDPSYAQPYGFAKTIAMIAVLDLSLSFDNVVAAVAFARDNIWMVYLGVTIGIITLRMVAGYCIKLIGKYPWLEHTAFILVGFVGCRRRTGVDQLIKTSASGNPKIIALPSGRRALSHEKIAKFTGRRYRANILQSVSFEGHLPPLLKCRVVLAMIACRERGLRLDLSNTRVLK